MLSTLIVDKKEDFTTVMALSGHKDIKMLKRYSHTREEAKKNAIHKIDINLEFKDSVKFEDQVIELHPLS